MTIKSPETFQNTEAFDDEIDLKELFLVLWNGKLLITYITGFAAVCAVCLRSGCRISTRAKRCLRRRMKAVPAGLPVWRGSMAGSRASLESISGGAEASLRNP